MAALVFGGGAGGSAHPPWAPHTGQGAAAQWGSARVMPRPHQSGTGPCFLVDLEA